MKNKFLLFFLVLSTAVIAGERSANEAAAMAADFMNQQVNAPARKASVGASAMQLSHTRMKLHSTAPAFYVFNQTSNNGYVVVSADDRTEDVLMYSDEGTLDVENANPNLKFWLNRLQEEISVVNDENAYTAAEKKARKATTATAISPLLVNSDGTEITWYQEAPYYNQCPQKSSSYCLTGCVATAAAQIMYKWRYPEKGTGSHSYTWNSKTLSKNFSTVTFDWDNMLPAYDGVSSTTAQKTAVATLMYCCGVACEMDYGTSSEGGSGAYTDMMGYGLTTYFGYTAERFITMASSSYYGSSSFTPTSYNVTSAQFESYFNADLEAGRPILMGGEDSDGGHEFVCDGRNTSGYFHINWGWEGESNNYCLLSSLKPSSSSYNFSSNIDALIGLQPAVIDSVHVTGVTMSPTTLTLKQKEKSTLSATVAPTDATDKTVTWSSSDSKIASVSAAGVVMGVAQGQATITATTKDGSKQATCAVTVTNEIIETTDCDNYSYTFTSKCSTGSNTLGKYTWNIVLNAGEIQSIDSNKGQQFGSSKNPCGQVSLTTSNTAECLIQSVKVNASMGSSGNAKLAVYIDGTQIDSTQTLTTAATEYTFANTAGEQGDLEIRLTNSAKAMYIKAIEVNPEDGGEVAVTGVALDKNTLTINKGASSTLVATVAPSDATNKNVTWVSDNENVATVNKGVVTAVAAGSAIIVVTTEDGNYKDSCQVTVMPVEVIVTLNAADTTQGVVFGAGTYAYNASVQIGAAGLSGYSFERWSDGVKVAARSITVTSDTMLTAYFATSIVDTIVVYDTAVVEVHDTTLVPIEVHDTTIVQVHDTTLVPIEVHDTTIVQVHDTTYLNMIEVNSMNPTMGTAILQVYAIPEEGYQFLIWSDYNTDNPRTVVQSDNPQTFTAVFTSTQPTNVSAQQEDEQGQVIKRIINGRLYIERNGEIYDATGNELK